jgi:hypothetical protein
MVEELSQGSIKHCYLFGLLLGHEDGDSMLLQNVGKLLPEYTALYPGRQKPQLSNCLMQCLMFGNYHKF